MGVKPFSVMEPVRELQVAGLIKVAETMTCEGFITTEMGVLGPSQVVAVTTWLT